MPNSDLFFIIIGKWKIVEPILYTLDDLTRTGQLGKRCNEALGRPCHPLTSFPHLWANTHAIKVRHTFNHMRTIIIKQTTHYPTCASTQDFETAFAIPPISPNTQTHIYIVSMAVVFMLLSQEN